MSIITIPTLDQRPTHKFTPLLRSEISRLTHRRLFRVLVLVLFGAILVISTIVFFAHNNAPASGTGEIPRSIERAEAQWQDCVKLLPRDQSVQEHCGPEPITQSFNAYDYGPDPRYKAYEALPVVLIGSAIAAAGVAFLMGASSGGAEWSSRSMTLQLLFEPRRLRLLCVKWLALALSTATVAAAAMALSVGFGVLTASARGTWDDQYALVRELKGHLLGSMLTMGGRGLILVMLAATLGYAVAMLVRNTGASLGVAFIYFVVLENGVRFALMRYGTEPFMLSTNAVASLISGGLDVPGEAKGRWGELSTVHVSNLRATVTMLAYCAIIAIPAAWSFTRRDVS